VTAKTASPNLALVPVFPMEEVTLITCRTDAPHAVVLRSTAEHLLRLLHLAMLLNPNRHDFRN
jgi:hypothetical protein